MQRLLHFFSYHNAVPIAISVLFVGGSAVFAATNPETIYSTSQKVLTVDNTYIVGKELTYYTPRIEIVGVTEDAENYYVAYRLTTIDVINAVWQDVTTNEVLTVAKGVLGEYDDLGLYVTRQLKQIIDRQVAYLREVQDIEKKQPSLKSVATSYGGLVGKFLDDTTETIPGYVPVVTPPPPPPDPEPQVAGAAVVAAQPEPQPQTQQPPPQPSPPETPPPQQPSQSPPSEPEGDTTRPVVQLLGDNPVQLAVGDAYADLGVAVTDNADHTLRKFIDGIEVSEISIDTSAPKQFEIRYEATDTSGNTGVAERTVIVSAPAPQPEPATTTSPLPTQGQDVSAPAEQTPAEEPTPADPVSATQESAALPAPAPQQQPEPAAQPTPEPESAPAPQT